MRNRKLNREWLARRRKESALWNRANTEKGVPVSTLLRLNRMVAEDIRELRANGFNWFKLAMGNDMLTTENYEEVLKQLEFVYLRTDAGIERAVKSMRDHGMQNIPSELVDRYLTTKPSDQPAVHSPDSPPVDTAAPAQN